MDASCIDMAQLWNAEAYLNGGKGPWTIFAYPASLADERMLPRDDESVRYLATLLNAGARVGVWYYPASRTVYFVCPFEERERLQFICDDLERNGTFPKNFSRDHCEYLFRLAAESVSN